MIGDFCGMTNLLGRIDQGHWIRWPLSGIGTSWATGIYAQIDGTHAVNLIALGILGVGSSCVGLWRLYEVQTIKIREARELSKIAIDEARRASVARQPEVIIVTQSPPPMAEPTNPK